MTEKLRIKQNAPELPFTWAATEFFYWNQEVIDILKKDVNDALLNAAYDLVNWELYFERLQGTPIYNWKKWGSGFLSLGGPAHKRKTTFSLFFGIYHSMKRITYDLHFTIKVVRI